VFVTGAMLMDALDGAGAATLLRQTRRAGATTLMDTVFVENLPALEWRRRVGPALENLDYFIPSEPEARALSGHNDPVAAARSFQGDGARNVVVKLGERGVLCLDSGGRDALVPAFAVPKVIDATGAGDCWAAGFIAGLREGRAFTDAARLGNAVAALSVQAPGATTGITGMAQVLELMQRSASAPASS
jgi:sugar/nucleoside kinase (ribokinase family)